MLPLERALASAPLESVLRQLPALDLAGCRVPLVQQARAAFNRGRVVSALWETLTTTERLALLYLLSVQGSVASRALWWCERSRVQARDALRRIITLLCAIERNAQRTGEAQTGDIPSPDDRCG